MYKYLLLIVTLTSLFAQKIDLSTQSKGILPAAQLPSVAVQTGKINTYSNFLQDFNAGKIKLPQSVVASLPAASLNTRLVYVVTDGTASSDCTTGNSNQLALCISNGTIWVALGGSGGSGFVFIGLLSGIPATCTIGQLSFITDATAGQNQYNCTSTNIWTQNKNTGGGATMASQLLDFYITKTSSTILTIGVNCSVSTPCIINGYRLITSPTVTISGAVNSGSVYIYVTSSLTLTIGHSTGTTLTCSAGCTVVTSTSSIPTDALALWIPTFAANVWDAVSPSMDNRAWLSNKVVVAGSGVSSSLDPTTKIQTISTDPTITPRFFTQAGSPTGNCVTGRDWKTDSTNFNFYGCAPTNTWVKLNGAGGTRTDIQVFPMAFYNNNDFTLPFLPGNQYNNNNNIVGVAVNNSGPNSLVYTVGAQLIFTSNFLMVTKKASSTWSAAAGTVDVEFTTITRDTPAAGTWNVNVYVGCAPITNGDFTYGTASALAITPPSVLGQFNVYKATAINLPGSCVADSPMQFWINRVADTGGSTGANMPVVSVEVIIRGN